MIQNDFYSIACNEYKYLLIHLDSDFYNNMALSCQQIAERALKSVLIYVNPDAKRIINSHNLRQIYNAINIEENMLNLDICKLSLLKDFYYETKYPGDNFSIISKEEFDIAYLTLLDVLNEVNKWRLSHNFDIEIPSTSLKSEQVLKSEISIEALAMGATSKMNPLSVAE